MAAAVAASSVASPLLLVEAIVQRQDKKSVVIYDFRVWLEHAQLYCMMRNQDIWFGFWLHVVVVVFLISARSTELRLSAAHTDDGIHRCCTDTLTS